MSKSTELKNKNLEEVIKNISDWKDTVYKTQKSWHANNLHLDEISHAYLDRALWVAEGLYCLKLLKQLNNPSPQNTLVPFLHIELTYSPTNKLPDLINKSFIQSQISEFTPPSLNFCTKDYYTGFYQVESVKCNIDENEEMFSFYFRTYFDTIENAYSREVYVFGN
jgi:hypothetical protein